MQLVSYCLLHFGDYQTGLNHHFVSNQAVDIVKLRTGKADLVRVAFCLHHSGQALFSPPGGICIAIPEHRFKKLSLILTS